MARDRSAVTVMLRDGTSACGTPDRVGADFVDLAIHGLDEAPRHRDVRARWSIARTAIGIVHRRADPDE